MSLADKNCVPSRNNTPPMNKEKAHEMLGQLDGGWNLPRDGHIEKRYKFNNFARALDFANKIGAIAETQDHHPDLYLAWGKCRVEIWTHLINGLTESDFVLAAKSDRAFNELQAENI